MLRPCPSFWERLSEGNNSPERPYLITKEIGGGVLTQRRSTSTAATDNNIISLPYIQVSSRTNSYVQSTQLLTKLASAIPLTIPEAEVPYPNPRKPVQNNAMSIFNSPTLILSLSLLLRLTFLLYGAWQDANSPVKYTDIDYLVFTDAARFVARGESPYARDTYRYTPLLAWLLVPTTWARVIPGAFAFGKVLFALADVLAGWLIARCLRGSYGMGTSRAMKFASVWLLNPMVANISTRGSSEGLLGVLVTAVLWAVLNRRIALAGVLLGVGVHFKIYPFIYGISVLWWLDSGSGANTSKMVLQKILAFVNPSRLKLTLTALVTFTVLNITMYSLYGFPFLQHTYLHHLTRIDHRHNFSPYSTLLYLSAASGDDSGTGTGTSFESLAFIPQILLSVVLIPILAKRDLAGTMLAQTFAFVGFNKVCTSQVCYPPSPLERRLLVLIGG